MNIIFELTKEFKKLILIFLLFLIAVPFFFMKGLDIHLSEIISVFEIENSYLKKDFSNKVLKLSYQKPQGWASLSEIDEQAYMAIVISEDWSYFEHNGFDIEQVKQSVADYLIDQKRLRGASTISQQLIKNLFTSSERTLKRKLKEYFLTMILETTTSKNKILETYLNNIQYGKSLYGITKASSFYFNKSPKLLNAKEGAFLAMLLPNPVRHAVSFEEQSLTDFAKEKISTLLFKLKVAKVISPEELDFYKTEFYLF